MVIYPNKGRLAFLLVNAVIFVAICGYILTRDAAQVPLKVMIAADVGTPFFAACGIYLLFRLLSRSPALIIDERGLTDNASFTSAGFIPWSDIQAVQIMQVKRQPFLAIHVTDPEQYLQRLNILQQILMRANLAITGCVVNIPQSMLPVRLNALLNEINRHLQSVAA
jgi:hypothetical protein